MEPPGGSRRPLATLLTLIVLIAAGGAISLLIRSGASTPLETRPTGTIGSPSSPGPTPTSSPTPVEASWTGPFAVSKTVLQLVDRTRTVLPPHTGTSKPAPRALPTVVWHPKLPEGTVPPAQGFPLVVFAHGFDVSPLAYAPLLRSWAAAGYVVAAPSFPLTKPGALGGLKEADLANQPADVRFVITKLLATNTAASSTLFGMIDPAEIAVAGHSDGGETAQGVAYGASSLDARVRAAIVMAGAEFFPERTTSRVSTPLFVAQGTEDVVNPPDHSQQLYVGAQRPKAYLSLIGADHAQPFIGTGRYERITATLTTDFLDRYLKDLPDAVPRLKSDGRSTPSLAKLTLAL